MSLFSAIYEDTAKRIVLPQEDSHISAVYATNEVTLKAGKIYFADSDGATCPHNIKDDKHWHQIFFSEVRYDKDNLPNCEKIADLVNDFLHAHSYSDEDIVEKIAKRWGPLWTTQNKFVFVGAFQSENPDYCWQGFEEPESYRALSSLLSGLAKLLRENAEVDIETADRIYGKLARGSNFWQWEIKSLLSAKRYKLFADSQWAKTFNSNRKELFLEILNTFFHFNSINLVFKGIGSDPMLFAFKNTGFKIVLDMRYGVTRILFHQLAKALARDEKTHGIFICDHCHEPYMRTGKLIPEKNQYCSDRCKYLCNALSQKNK